MNSNVVVDFKQDLKMFPKFLTAHLLGLAHANLTQFNDLSLLAGSALLTGKNRTSRSLGIYLLLWVYYRNRPVR